MTGGFFGNGLIELGRGDDLIRGSISSLSTGASLRQRVDGGRGFDTAELGMSLGSFSLSLSAGFDIRIDNNNGGIAYTNVERFIFTDQTLTLTELQALV